MRLADEHRHAGCGIVAGLKAPSISALPTLFRRLVPMRQAAGTPIASSILLLTQGSDDLLLREP